MKPLHKSWGATAVFKNLSSSEPQIPMIQRVLPRYESYSDVTEQLEFVMNTGDAPKKTIYQQRKKSNMECTCESSFCGLLINKYASDFI